MVRYVGEFTGSPTVTGSLLSPDDSRILSGTTVQGDPNVIGVLAGLGGVVVGVDRFHTSYLTTSYQSRQPLFTPDPKIKNPS